MSEYVVRLLIVLPLICGMIVASLWIAKRLQGRTLALGTKRGERMAEVVEVQGVSPGVKLAVIGFAGKRVLVGIDKQGMHRLAIDEDVVS
ncbi:flagellar biosynthetic protein FliO [Pacificimonas sp. WHA3]|uniref:Flagellar biosynthetic protein FliO n=1 Tax=Pacificimonas pallii TaxID=2827236 RepID=A0ABS6SF17_9SPHN|nr:flagellar biogenesis protein FliO [Pacificimonas pallii]MBV7256994.1 flagellar biosynthetic protein FliO [Pacificimonas pallii]